MTDEKQYRKVALGLLEMQVSNKTAELDFLEKSIVEMESDEKRWPTQKIVEFAMTYSQIYIDQKTLEEIKVKASSEERSIYIGRLKNTAGLNRNYLKMLETLKKVI
jgi:hypothetical protein